MDGDPKLGLNSTQLRAVANAVLNNFSLIQGVSQYHTTTQIDS